ncbi:hypothetical protein ACL2XP_20730 [Sodalis sp. RH21]
MAWAKRRQAKGWIQAEATARANVNRSTISKMQTVSARSPLEKKRQE